MRLTRLVLRCGVRLALSSSFLAGAPALAQLAFPDPTFGSGGTVLTDFIGLDDRVNAVVALADGRTLAAGSASVRTQPGQGTVRPQIALARTLANGALDPGFGTAGRVTTPIGANSSASAVAVDPEGRIVAAGQSCSAGSGKCQLALVRYLENGTLDATFGSGGIVTLSFGNKSFETAGLAVLASGRIVVGGRAGDAFAAARLDENGTLDASFGTGGVATMALERSVFSAPGFLTTPDGYVMLAGGATGPNGDEFAVVCLDAAGSPETEFAGTGHVFTGFGEGGDVAHAIARAPDGGFLVGGTATIGGRPTFAVGKFRENGTLDAGFGTAGRAVVDLGAPSRINALAMLPTGTLAAAGTFQKPNGETQVALAFLKADGSPDTDFGASGLVKMELGGTPAAYALAAAPLGRLVAGGTASVEGQQDFALLRWIASQPGDVDWNGRWDQVDFFQMFRFLFTGAALPSGNADANGDGRSDVLDLFYLINYLFAGGSAPHS